MLEAAVGRHVEVDVPDVVFLLESGGEFRLQFGDRQPAREVQRLALEGVFGLVGHGVVAIDVVDLLGERDGDEPTRSPHDRADVRLESLPRDPVGGAQRVADVPPAVRRDSGDDEHGDIDQRFVDRERIAGPADVLDEDEPCVEVNRLGVKWFERLRLSSSRKTTSSVRPRGFPWVSRTLPSDHRPDSLGRSSGSRSGRPRPPMPAVVIRKSEIFVITKDSVFRSTPSEQREGC